MKILDFNSFVTESVNQKTLDNMYKYLNINGVLPTYVANALSQFTLYEIDNTKLIDLVVDNTQKTLFFRNLKTISATIKQYDKLINTGYDLLFNENSNIIIRSGGTLEKSGAWPDLCGYPLDWLHIVNYIGNANPNHKFRSLSLNRFKCYEWPNNFPKVYFDKIAFIECRYENEMKLPTTEQMSTWVNPNMKFNSSSKRAQTYYAENNMLIGTEEEVKSHWTKSFAKEFAEKKEAETKRLNRIKPTLENPPCMYTNKNGDPCICLDKCGSNFIFSIVFSKSASGTSIESDFWKSHEDFVWLQGAHVKIDGILYEIIKYTVEGGYWTDGRNCYDFYIKRID